MAVGVVVVMVAMIECVKRCVERFVLITVIFKKDISKCDASGRISDDAAAMTDLGRLLNGGTFDVLLRS